MPILRHRALSLVSLVVVTGLLGVATAPRASAQAGKSVQQRQMEAQVKLQEEVRHVLVMVPFYSVFDNLEYKVEGDHVVLSGQVTDPSLKSNAGKAVQSIEGVSSLDNQIEVLPLSPNDNRIRLAEYRAIYSAPNLQKYEHQAVPPIHIIVKGGHVTLEGVVLDQGDKTTADLRAKGVSGVFSVTNNLRTEK
jgi:osmotically-inducible protein OsmY